MRLASGLHPNLAGLAVALDDVHEAPPCGEGLVHARPVLRLTRAVHHPAALAAPPDERRMEASPGAVARQAHALAVLELPSADAGRRHDDCCAVHFSLDSTAAG